MPWNPHVTSEALCLVVPGAEVQFRSMASIMLFVRYSLTGGDPSVSFQQMQKLSVLADTENIKVTDAGGGVLCIDIRPPGAPRRL